MPINKYSTLYYARRSLIKLYKKNWKDMFTYQRITGIAVVIVWYFDLQLPMQLVHITTNVVGSNPAHGKVNNIML